MLAKQSFVYKHPLASTNFKFKANYEIFNMPKVVIPTSLIKELCGAKVWRFVPENKHLICKLELYEDEGLVKQLATIKVNFTVLKSSITQLEERLTLVQALEIVENVKKSLTIPEFKAKLDEILEKNPGYEKQEKMGAVLSGNTVPDIAGEDPNVIASFRCTPMTSVDCERAFSRFKDLLSTKRARLTEGHLKDQMLIQ